MRPGKPTSPTGASLTAPTSKSSPGSTTTTLRVNGQLHHIGIGRTLNRTRIIMLINGYDVRIIHAATGEIIRTLTINPERRYHGTGNPIGGPSRPTDPTKTRNPNPDEGSDPCVCLATSHGGTGGI